MDTIKSGAGLSLSTKTLLNIMYTQNVLAESFEVILKRHGLSSGQFNVLRILDGQLGKPASMGMIQQRMMARASNTTRLVDKLLPKGLVTREVCYGNRRKMEVLITEKGSALLDSIRPAIDAHESRFANSLTRDELESLNVLLDKYRGLMPCREINLRQDDKYINF